MPAHRRRTPLLLHALLLVLPIPAAVAAAPGESGLVVEAVGDGSALDKAGVRPGDRLFTWEREADRGALRTVFDWLWLAVEQAPRGPVRLSGERQGTALAFEVPQGDWEARLRPWMAPEALSRYEEGRENVERGAVEAGVAGWEELGRSVPELGLWLHYAAGKALAAGGRRQQAEGAFEAALAEAADPSTRVALLEELSDGEGAPGAIERAEARLRSAVETSEAAWGESLQLTRSLSLLGGLLRVRNQPQEAAELLHRALAIERRLAPDSLALADSLERLGAVARVRGDLATTADLDRQALAIRERWAPDGLAASRSLNALGLVAIEHGRLEEAAELLGRALAIRERRAPESRYVAVALANLGQVARLQGDLEVAEERLQRSLAIFEKVAPGAASVIAPTLNNLAAVARQRGDLATARALFERAITVWSVSAPEGLGVAGGYDVLGQLAREKGELDAAASYLGRSLAIHARLAPGGIDEARNLLHLGEVDEARGDLATARERCRGAVATLERLAPGTLDAADALARLAHLEGRLGHGAEAAAAFARAVDTLEAQVGTLGGSQELRSEFRARHAAIYQQAIEAEVGLGRTAEAFHLSERSRARGFLALLAERELAFVEQPPELERRRRDNAANYDRALQKLAGWTAKDGEPARAELEGQLASLRRQREDLQAQLRKASPRLASLGEPAPLDLEGARLALDPGTLALAFSVGEEKTLLFALTREGGLAVHVLPLGEAALRREVASFLEAIAARQKTGTELYLDLLAPAADLLAASERLLVLPDGPLWRVPWGALRDPQGRFLIEGRPVHTALSLTVYAALRAGDRQQAGSVVVAFADPLYRRTSGVEEPARVLRGLDWSPLPFSRREAEELATTFPGAHLYLGQEASEENAKSIHQARILHFATHAFLDDRTPLDSALVLTLPEALSAGRENGLLQVWEVLESVRLDADLVVLSACETALGREQSGEGLIGLTRAFHFAGARSVLASLWSVADQVTAELMARFYRHLAAGRATDEALRAAQLELIAAPVPTRTAQGQSLETDASAPYFWAASELFGDWR